MSNNQAEDRAGELERAKVAIDVVKHVSTLSTGSIVLIATLLDKFPKPIAAQWQLAAAILCLVFCLACCLYYLVYVGVSGNWKERNTGIGGVVGMLIGWSFLVGILFLGIFAIQNVHKLPSTQPTTDAPMKRSNHYAGSKEPDVSAESRAFRPPSKAWSSLC